MSLWMFSGGSTGERVSQGHRCEALNACEAVTGGNGR